MRFSDALGRKVVDLGTAQTVARVDGFVVDPARRAVVALELGKSEHGRVVTWAGLAAFGEDAVTVSHTEEPPEPPEEVAALLGKDHRLVGKRALSAAGDGLGTVRDVEFDPDSGAVTALVLDGGEVPGSRLVGVGSYAVVVATA